MFDTQRFALVNRPETENIGAKVNASAANSPVHAWLLMKRTAVGTIKKASEGQCKTDRNLALQGQGQQRQEGVSEAAPTTYTNCLGP